MERCVDCNYLLTKEEKVCNECGSKVGGEESGAMDFLAGIVSILFYLSFAAMVTSPFLSSGPSFMLCMLTTCALLFVMRTAKDGARKLKRR
jgi:hypothetical protein